MSRFVFIASITSLVLVSAASSASAQYAAENTAQACRDGVDNDGDGHLDCADQDCSFMSFCGQASASPAVVSAGWALPGAIIGFSTAPIVLGLALGAEFTKYNDTLADEVMGGSALLLAIALGPVVAVSASSARRAAGVRGCLACRIIGWIGYGLAIADGATLLGLGLGAGITSPDGLITSVGLLGATSFCLLGVDALLSRRQALARPQASTPRRSWSMAPYFAPVSDGENINGAVAGMTIITL